MPIRSAEASWKGTSKNGQGWLRTETGALQGTYSFGSRFQSEKGTNPEELIAAAHAGCFSMALSLMLTEAGYEPEAIDTRAGVSIEPQDGGFAITRIVLTLKAKVPGIDEATFMSHANNAKEGCPVSQALKAVPVELNAQLV